MQTHPVECKPEVSVSTDDLQRYQSLLSELDDWINSTHSQIKSELPKFTSVSAVVKELNSSKVQLIHLDIHFSFD